MAMAKKKNFDPTKLKAFSPTDADIVHCVIETPMGSRNKFKFDEEIGSYALSGVLPQGMMFPHAFGFIPGTKAADGDPEDVLVIMDLPVFTGCVVPSRLIGVIEAEQTEDGETDRNDRLLAVAAHSKDYSDVNSLQDLNGTMLKEIEQFFVNYNKEKGKKFRVLGRKGPQEAMKLLKKSLK
jgi:inorganic pyrophosphatase